MEMNEYSPELDPHHWMQFSVRQDTLIDEFKIFI